MSRNILITGGCGFIGSHVVNYFVDKYPKDKIIIIDSLTYASNYENVKGLKKGVHGGVTAPFSENLEFIQMDIRQARSIDKVFSYYDITHVIHLAAESHVDNSIENPTIFVETNVMGTVNLLNSALKHWKKDDYENHRFHHVSTDEVYGALGLDDETFTEETPYAPHSPYSASKASSDHFVRAYHDTYGLPITISNCSNNYGPHQHTEKLIPKIISNLRDGELIPVYGTGENIRDWLYVGDHVKAIDCILEKGKVGETYNIGGDNEITNIDIITKICYIYATELETMGPFGVNGVMIPIQYVEDRKGHDLRYGINSTKIKEALSWRPEMDFEKGIIETIKYYIDE